MCALQHEIRVFPGPATKRESLSDRIPTRNASQNLLVRQLEAVWSRRQCPSRKSDPLSGAVVRLGIDGHVLDGKRQGSRSVLINFLRALESLGRSDVAVTVYCDDPERHAADPTMAAARFAPLDAHGRTKRLLFGGLGKPGDSDVEFYSYALPLTGRCKSILLVHDVLPFTHKHLFAWTFRIPFGILVRRSIARAGRILTVSETGRVALTALAPEIASRTAVALNGPSFPAEVYLAPAVEKGASGLRPYILCVGRIEKRKNVHLLIDAFLKADLADVDLVIVGRLDEGFKMDFPDDARVRQEVDIDDERLINLYRGAALFVYPSAAEGFGIPLLDGLAFGLPTISSNQTSMPEVGGVLPHYFDPTSQDACDTLAAAVKGHFQGQPIAAPSIEARRDLLSRFSWQRFATTILDAACDAAKVS